MGFTICSLRAFTRALVANDIFQRLFWMEMKCCNCSLETADYLSSSCINSEDVVRCSLGLLPG